MYSVLFAFFIASQIHSQVTPFAPKDVEMRNPFEVQSGVQAWSCIHTMHLAGCLGFWYLEVWWEYSLPSMIWYLIFLASAESFGSI